MRQNLTALNGLRIFAAAVLIGFHYGMLTESFLRLPHFLQNVVGNGTIALPFFYLLSGFVLTHAYTGRIASPRQKRDFCLARFCPVVSRLSAGFRTFSAYSRREIPSPSGHQSTPRSTDIFPRRHFGSFCRASVDVCISGVERSGLVPFG